MDKIDAKCKADNDMSQLLYQAEISIRRIEICAKLFALQISFFADYGRLDIDKKDLDTTNQKVLSCIQYAKGLRKQYKQQEITADEGYQLWDNFTAKTLKELLNELKEQETNRYKELR